MDDGSGGGQDERAVSTASLRARVPGSYRAADAVVRSPEVLREPAAPISCSRHHAALRGDPSAFAELCAELRDSLTRAVGRHKSVEGQEVCEECVQRVVARVFELAFDELDEKPADWSMYGWMSWLAVREITRAPCSTPR